MAVPLPLLTITNKYKIITEEVWCQRRNDADARWSGKTTTQNWPVITVHKILPSQSSNKKMWSKCSKTFDWCSSLRNTEHVGGHFVSLIFAISGRKHIWHIGVNQHTGSLEYVLFILSSAAQLSHLMPAPSCGLNWRGTPGGRVWWSPNLRVDSRWGAGVGTNAFTSTSLMSPQLEDGSAPNTSESIKVSRLLL